MTKPEVDELTRILSAKTPWAVLGLAGGETFAEINRTYKRLALIYHPDKPGGNSKAFVEISAAFKLLEQEKRELYEVKEEEGEEAAPERTAEPKKKRYKQPDYDEDGIEVTNSNNNNANPEVFRTSSRRKAKASQKARDEVIELFVPLEDLYYGKQHIHIFDNGHIQPVDILPGFGTGARIVYPGGSTKFEYGKAPGDLVFLITEIVHPVFKRTGNTLTCKIAVPLATALTADSVSVTAIDGVKYTIPIPADEIIGPGCNFQKKLVGLGMPSGRTNEIGDLIVDFEVEMPEALSDMQKQEIERLMKSCEHRSIWAEQSNAASDGDSKRTGEEIKMPAGSLNGKKPRKKRPSAAEKKKAADAGEDIFRKATSHVASDNSIPEYGGDIVVPLYLSLEDIYLGTVVTYKDNVTVPIPAGVSDGFEICHAGKGQTGKDGDGDLVFVVRELKHGRFSRLQHDLLHIQTLPLWRALTGKLFPVVTLDGRSIELVRTNPEKPVHKYEKILISGEGMPSACPGNKTKGCLRVGFSIIYPMKVGADVKAELKKLF